MGADLIPGRTKGTLQGNMEKWNKPESVLQTDKFSSYSGVSSDWEYWNIVVSRFLGALELFAGIGRY